MARGDVTLHAIGTALVIVTFGFLEVSYARRRKVRDVTTGDLAISKEDATTRRLLGPPAAYYPTYFVSSLFIIFYLFLSSSFLFRGPPFLSLSLSLRISASGIYSRNVFCVLCLCCSNFRKLAGHFIVAEETSLMCKKKTKHREAITLAVTFNGASEDIFSLKRDRVA